jgi:hypothetical protein
VQEVPRKFKQQEMAHWLPKRKEEAIRRATQKIVYKVGAEYSVFVDEAMKKSRGMTAIFEDRKRFDEALNERAFFESTSTGKPAGQRFALPVGCHALNRKKLWDTRSFIGKKGDVSCLHFDWNQCANILFNLSGVKKVELFHPKRSESLRGYGNFTFNKKLKPDIVFEIKEGEGVWMPPLWWHRISYLTDACSISFRFAPSSESLFVMNHLYPSWKAVQALATMKSNLMFQRYMIGAVSSGDTPHIRFKNVENAYRQILGHQPDDHRFYALWSKGHLRHKLLKKQAVVFAPFTRTGQIPRENLIPQLEP